MIQCRKWSKGLQNIENSAARFIAETVRFRYAQMEYQTSIYNKAQKMNEDLASERTETRLRDASEKLVEYTSVLKASIQDFTGEGKETRDLKQAMDDMRAAGRALNSTLNTELPN